MDCVYDQNDNHDAAVTIGSSASSWVRLWNRLDPWGDGSIDVCVQVAVETATEHLRAEAHGVTLGVMGGEDLSPFLAGLVENFQGWKGVQSWRSFNADFGIDAVHLGSHVEMTWTVSTWRHVPSTWTASVTLPLQAGEELRAVATEVRWFLRPEQQ